MFLHPAQADLVSTVLSGPTRVSGSAGTGKTIVALHRAVHLARDENTSSMVLLTTFSQSPCTTHCAGSGQSGCRRTSRRESDHSQGKYLRVGYDAYSERFGQPQLASPALIRSLVTKAAAEVDGHRFSIHFLIGEWSDVVDAWQLRSWDEYRDVSRLGRKTRIGGKAARNSMGLFESVREGFAVRGNCPPGRTSSAD